MPLPKTKFRRLDGILLLDKPQGLSSNQALQRARHLFRAEKGGHTGSLDPLATGLLPLCFGEATKIAGSLLGARKAYDTVARLGITTDTDDADRVVLHWFQPDFTTECTLADGTFYRVTQIGAGFRWETNATKEWHLIIHRGSEEQFVR